MSYQIREVETGRLLYKNLTYADTEQFRQIHGEDIDHFVIEDQPEAEAPKAFPCYLCGQGVRV